jgi:DNA gyrase/topoisomerase IV subunit A
MTVFSKETATASEVQEELIYGFTHHSVAGKIPHVADGLPKYLRRVLCAFHYKSKGQEVTELVQAWMSEVRKNHPHGEGAIEGTIYKLMQEHRYENPFIKEVGSAGIYRDTNGAAPRYLEAYMTSFASEVLFNTNPAALKFVPNESSNNLEEQYLIPTIPTALLLWNEDIASGFSTFQLPRNFHNICDLTLLYLDLITKQDQEQLNRFHGNIFTEEQARLLLPSFPIVNHVMNTPELIEHYRKGDYRIGAVVEGDLHMTDKSIIVKTIPFGNDYDKRFNRLLECKINKRPPEFYGALDRIIDDLEEGETRASYTEIKFKRGVDPFDHLDAVRAIMGIKGKITPVPYYLGMDGKPDTFGPGQLMHIWYGLRYNAAYINLNKTFEAIYNDIRKYEALIIVQSDIDKVVSISKSYDSKTVPRILMEEFGLTLYQAKIVADVKLSELSTDRREVFRQILDGLRAKIPEIQKQLEDIPGIIRDQIIKLKGKYPTIRNTTYNRAYCGLARRGNNIVGIADPVMIPSEEWDTLICKPYHKYIYYWNGYKYVDNTTYQLPKYFRVPGQIFTSDEPMKYTVSVCTDSQGRKSVSYTNQLATSDQPHILAGEYVTVVDRMGKCKRVLTRSLPLRKSANAQGNLVPDFCFLSNVVSKKRLAFVWSEKDPKILRVTKLLGTDDQLNSLIGKPFEIIILPFTKDDIVLTLNRKVYRVKDSSTLLVNSIPAYRDFLKSDDVHIKLKLHDVKPASHKRMY